MATVKILKGFHAKRWHTDVSFKLLKGLAMGQKGPFLLVDGTGIPGYPQRAFRMFVQTPADYMIEGEDAAAYVTAVVDKVGDNPEFAPNLAAFVQGEVAEPAPVETIEEIKARMAERFEILTDMTKGASRGKVRGMVVSGAPGVGKSFEVEKALRKDNFMDQLSFNPEADDQDPARVSNNGTFQPRYEFVKGHVSARGLYKLLFENQDKSQVLVFDDCDNALFDETSLNLLKSALDTSAKRWIKWMVSGDLKDDLPSKFEYKGSIIFITNINFDKMIREGRNTKLTPHLQAIMDRCFYLDMTIDTIDEKLIRIEQVSVDFGMLAREGLEPEEATEVLDFVKENAKKFRELSLRKVIQCAGLRRMRGTDWKRVAQVTLFKGR